MTLPLTLTLTLTLAQVGGALSTISAICGVGFYACVALSWLATLVLLGAHVSYGGALTARARSGPATCPALLEATEATPSAIHVPHSAVTTSPLGRERESANSSILPAILNGTFCLLVGK